MFKISDDLDFDDDLLDTEIHTDFPNSGSFENQSLANVNKIPTKCSAQDLAPLKVGKETSTLNSTSLTPGTSFKPKSKRSATLQEGKQAKVTAVTENITKYNQPKNFQNGVHLNENSFTKPPQSTSFHNNLFDEDGKSFCKPRSSIPISSNTRIHVNNLDDASESPFKASNRQSSVHSEFLAEWNDNFFNAEPNERTLSKPRLDSVNSLPSTTEAVTRKVNKTVRQRKFPGPAGLLPPRQGCTSLIAPEEFINELKSEECDPAYEETELLSQSSGSVFEGGAWSAMLDDLGTAGKSLLKSINLASVKAIGRNLRSYKVPFLVVLVQSVDTSLPDAAVGFKDPTGEMHGVVHRDVWEQFSSDISVGTVLVLKNVGIMSAGISSRQHVVNITGRNLTAIYSPKDELNIQLRQIHAFAANNSSKLLEDWEKLERQNSPASPHSNRMTIPPLPASPFNNSARAGIHPKHSSLYNSNSRETHFISSSSSSPRPPSFNSPMHCSNQGVPRFTSSTPNSSTRLHSSSSPFTPMPSRLCNDNSVRYQSPMMQNRNTSHSSTTMQQRTAEKSPCFAIKAPSSNRTVLAESSHRGSNIPPAPNIISCQQQSARHLTSTSSSTIPSKKSKVCENVGPIGKVTKTSNPFQVNETSAVDALLEGLDTDSLFGDF